MPGNERVAASRDGAAVCPGGEWERILVIGSVGFRRGLVVGTLGLCMSLWFPLLAHAETPLQAFCADNAVELQRTNLEMGLDPGKWASNQSNLARFGFSYASDTNTLYQMVIGPGAPAIKSYWSDMNQRVEWRCAGQ